MPEEPEVPTREELEALTKPELAERYDVSAALSKEAMVDAVIASDYAPKPDGEHVTLAVGFPVVSHRIGEGDDALVITATGTKVPTADAADIIAAAAAQGVTIRKVA